MAAEAVVATLRQAWSILTNLKIPSALIGGLALANWGRVRSTQDVDLLIALDAIRPQALLAQLAAAGYRSKGARPLIRLEDAEFIQLLHEPREAFMDVQIDLLLADSPFHRQAIERRVPLPVTALGFELDVVSCEDLILLKLLAWRMLDRADASELLKINQATLDIPYLAGWVRQLNLQQRFSDAWNDAFPGVATPI